MIRFARTEDIGDIKKMWKLSFSDSDKSATFYFSRLFRPDQTLLLEVAGVVASSMQIMPYTLKLGDRRVKAGYIYGAMTHPEHRRKGYMGKLLQAAFEEMDRMGMEVSFLIPQNERLFGFYSSFGYKPAFPVVVEKIRVDMNAKCSQKSFLLPDQLNIDATYSLMLAEKQNVVLKNSGQAQMLLDEFLFLGGQVFVCPEGVALTYQVGREVYIKELFAGSEASKTCLLTGIARHYRIQELNLFRYVKTNESAYYGMLRPVGDGNKQEWPVDMYMSMMFD